MAQATYSVRLDQDKKAEFDKICERLGLSSSAAISTFVSKTVEVKGIPFELTLSPTLSDYGVIEADNLSREELMAEIEKGIDSAETGHVHPAEEVFREILGEGHARV